MTSVASIDAIGLFFFGTRRDRTHQESSSVAADHCPTIFKFQQPSQSLHVHLGQDWGAPVCRVTGVTAAPVFGVQAERRVAGSKRISLLLLAAPPLVLCGARPPCAQFFHERIMLIGLVTVFYNTRWTNLSGLEGGAGEVVRMSKNGTHACVPVG